MAFKMKGNPMKRNFGIGAPTKQDLGYEPDSEDLRLTRAKDDELVEDAPEGGALPQDKFANLANIDLNPKVGHGGVQGTHTMEGLE